MNNSHFNREVHSQGPLGIASQMMSYIKA